MRGTRCSTLCCSFYWNWFRKGRIDKGPIIVTINNHPLARPQSGIADADIIYEMLAEGNVTRFLALYQSEIPEEVGPVRSARDYFVDMQKVSMHFTLHMVTVRMRKKC